MKKTYSSRVNHRHHQHQLLMKKNHYNIIKVYNHLCLTYSVDQKNKTKRNNLSNSFRSRELNQYRYYSDTSCSYFRKQIRKYSKETRKFFNTTNHSIPIIGYGTYQIDPDQVYDCLNTAIDFGYRHIDCASRYNNQYEIGIALEKGMNRLNLHRQDLFITSKLWNTDHDPKYVQRACLKTLDELRLSYLDLYLIHWPVSWKSNPNITKGIPPVIDPDINIIDTWKAMNDLVVHGYVKSVGVSNFSIDLISKIYTETNRLPVTNQIELHPHLTQNKMRAYCQHHLITITSYSPIARGEILNEKMIHSIAERNNKTPAQVVLRWGIQNGFIVIPKSSNLERIKENIDIFDFDLDDKEMDAVNKLNKNYRVINPSWYAFEQP